MVIGHGCRLTRMQAVAINCACPRYCYSLWHGHGGHELWVYVVANGYSLLALVMAVGYGCRLYAMAVRYGYMLWLQALYGYRLSMAVGYLWLWAICGYRLSVAIGYLWL